MGNHNNSNIEPRLLDVHGLARYLGKTKYGVINLIRKGKLPITRCGDRRIMFDKKAIDVWIEKNTYER